MRMSPTWPYEREADSFAAALNMPPSRFREDMKSATPGMKGVLELASSYSASAESAAIHYVELAGVACSLLRLDPASKQMRSGIQNGPYKVRYQIRNDLFPFLIQSGQYFEKFPDEFVDFRVWQSQLISEGLVHGESFGLGDLGREVELRSFICRADRLGGILALLFLTKPLTWSYYLKVIEEMNKEYYRRLSDGTK